LAISITQFNAANTMRIGFYTPSYPGLTGEGGVGTYTRALGHGLSRLGHEVHVLTLGKQPGAADGPVRVHFARSNHFRGIDRLIPGAGACWRVGRAIRRMVRTHRLDVIELANWEGFGLGFLLWPRRAPVVVRLHTSSHEAQQIDGVIPNRTLRWEVKRENWQARWADLLVTHSNAHRQKIADEVGIAADRIRCFPHGIEVFPDFVRSARRPGPPTVVFLGRLESRKGTTELLQAVPQVIRAIPETRFVLIGRDRPHCPGMRTHAQYLEQEFPPEVRKQVNLTGQLPQPDVDRWLQSADLFVAPSRYESFGLVFLEAMRWGTPVLGTLAGGIPEVVENGRSGVLVAPESPDQLAGAIIGLLNDPERRAALGAEGRRRAEQEFSVAKMSERAAAMYDELVRTRHLGRGWLAQPTHAKMT
jgi:glycogen synthase